MAGTINLANVAIGFDVSKLQKGTEFSRSELRTLSKVVQDSVSPVDRYNRELNLLEKAHKAGAVSADRMSQAVGHLQDKYLKGPAGGAAIAVGGGAGGDITRTLAQYASLATAAGAIKKSLSLAAIAETNKISLEVLTGSAQKAQMLFQGFIELDRSSPLSRAEFARGAQTLIGYGFAAESTLPALKALSEVSVGNAERFQSLSLAFGQVTANGRLMGQEVLQMVNAGFNPLQEISRTTGRSMIDLKKAMEDGAISASMVEDAFRSATSEGGRFFEMNEKLKSSAAGQFAKLQSDVEQLATEIGTNLLPATKAFMDLLTMGKNEQGEKGMLASLSETVGIGAEGLLYAVTLQQDKFDDLMYRLIDGKTKAEMERGNVHKNTQEEQERVAKITSERARKERDDLEAIAKREKEVQDQAKKAAEEKEALAKKAESDRKQRMEKMITDAERLKKSVANPLEEYKAELNRLQAMIDNGLIDQKTFDRADKEAKDRLVKNDNPNNIAAAVAPALRAGSVEAYKFLMDQKNEEMELALKQTEIAEMELELSKQQLEAIKEIQPIGRAR